jgi:hypothetical protein
MERANASIERGEILSASDGGYTITSLDREGIETPPLKPINDATYATGEKVYFFYFKDGTGRIICKI